MPYRQPRSIQVVIYAEESGVRLYLLLRRLPAHGAFWQTITGSLELGETHLQAAVREVAEETGFTPEEEDLHDLGVVNCFEIAALWRPQFAPEVSHNEEVCFALRVKKGEVRIDPMEHDAYQWVDFETAIGTVYWESSKKALMAVDKLPKREYS